MPHIRLANGRDAAVIAAIYAPIVTSSVISFEVEAPTTEMLAKRIAHTLPTYPWLVSEDSGDAVGYAYASQRRSRAAYQW